jgi:hypothetical protein
MRLVDRQMFPSHLVISGASTARLDLYVQCGSDSCLWRTRMQSQVVVGCGRAAVQARVGEKPRMHASSWYAQSPFQKKPDGRSCAWWSDGQKDGRRLKEWRLSKRSQARRDFVGNASFLGGGVRKIAFARSRRLVSGARGATCLTRSAKQLSLVEFVGREVWW